MKKATLAAFLLLASMAFGQGGVTHAIPNATALPNPAKQWTMILLTSGATGLYICKANPTCSATTDWFYVMTTTTVVNTVVDTGSTVTVSTTLASEYHFNENATAATAITYNLPTAAAGKQFCFSNAYNGSAANTGTLTLQTSASGQFLIYTDGTLSATGGYVISGGAAADAACVVGVDSTHWMLYTQRGTWTKH